MGLAVRLLTGAGWEAGAREAGPYVQPSETGLAKVLATAPG
jgi:hypothetical protein